MLRRSLFWGLTLMLSAVLVWLIINGRKEEARLASAPSEVVQTAKLSPTRAIAPSDLEVAESNVVRTNREDTPELLGPVAIRNRGHVAYHGTMLRLQCLDSSGKVVDTRTRLAPDTIAPGQSITITDITLEKVPRSTIRYHISIAFSDLGPAPGSDDEGTKEQKTKGSKQ